jgi:hypothetical protein
MDRDRARDNDRNIDTDRDKNIDKQWNLQKFMQMGLIRHHRDDFHPHLQSGGPLPVLYVSTAHGMGRISTGWPSS